MTMKRTTIVVAVLVGFVLGGITGGRLMSAEAQRRPAPVAAKDCPAELADRVAMLAAVKRAERQARMIADRERANAQAARAENDELRRQLEDTRAELARLRRRVEEMLKQLGPELEADGF